MYKGDHDEQTPTDVASTGSVTALCANAITGMLLHDTGDVPLFAQARRRDKPVVLDDRNG